MKSFALLAILFASPSLWAQAGPATPQATPGPQQHQRWAAGHHDMMAQCAESMKKGLASAEQNLTDMKAALAQLKTDDPAAHRLAELNVQMWENEVAHMREMAAMHDKMQDEMKAMHDRMHSMNDQKPATK